MVGGFLAGIRRYVLPLAARATHGRQQAQATVSTFGIALRRASHRDKGGMADSQPVRELTTLWPAQQKKEPAVNNDRVGVSPHSGI